MAFASRMILFVAPKNNPTDQRSLAQGPKALPLPRNLPKRYCPFVSCGVRVTNAFATSYNQVESSSQNGESRLIIKAPPRVPAVESHELRARGETFSAPLRCSRIRPAACSSCRNHSQRQNAISFITPLETALCRPSPLLRYLMHAGTYRFPTSRTTLIQRAYSASSSFMRILHPESRCVGAPAGS